MKESTVNSEHILLCLSPSPSNRKVISAAAKMAAAFNAAFTAVYVRSIDQNEMTNEDKARLQSNMRFAEQNGATVTTITGNNIPEQIAEFARVCGATKIVVGRSGIKRQKMFGRVPLTEQIILNVPEIDVYIIPDSAVEIKEYRERIRRFSSITPTWKESLITLLLLIAATGVGLIFTRFGFSEANIITVYILVILIISAFTVSPVYGAVSSLASVLLFNYFFTEPRFSFHTYETEYIVTFVIMFASSLITGTLANRLKNNASHAAREAYRTKVLLDTSRLLQKADNTEEAIQITANQAVSLLNRDIAIYPVLEDGSIGEMILYKANQYGRSEEEDQAYINDGPIVEWVKLHQEPAGFQLEQYGTSTLQYYPVSINNRCYGVIGIRLEENPLEPFEYSVFNSIIGECAITLQSIRNAAEKERAAVIARNEKLRSNLLRSISHDIRTPLTSISGNASNLLTHFKQLDEETLKQIFSDIYDDSEWMIDLVENLLSISRIENGEMQLRLSSEMMNDVIEEALNHVDRRAADHHITTESNDDFLLVKMDSQLIMQVLINLVNNAIKNTQEGSDICIVSKQQGSFAEVSVRDNGPGILDQIKPFIFEMFYTGNSKVADGRRGIGLGLALCKTIIEAHGGRIYLTDNIPSGCCFTFVLPMAEVNVNE